MFITHDTTIEEYEAWLATNPSLSAFAKAVDSVYKAADKLISRIKRAAYAIIKRVKKAGKAKACTAGVKVQSTVYPDGWVRSADVEMVEAELAMEQLFESALALLISNNLNQG
jgi:hypothetical protein